jgi:hypothetical protein
MVQFEWFNNLVEQILAPLVRFPQPICVEEFSSKDAHNNMKTGRRDDTKNINLCLGPPLFLARDDVKGS